MIFFCGNNVGLPLVLDSLNMKWIFNIYDLYMEFNWVRGSSSVPNVKTWWANISPVQTEQMRNIYFMSTLFIYEKKLQANFIE